ncbi:probable disease resistance protein At1g61300 [Gastrolobium bilobum]|uniref:probable disease resistance protein At1g61300 n=1 Tax=Gastrolobium bilobum TaxID=150636 RepID=UPI002AB02A95|nr:probable disease resistance protein At1g61300 [Gastrolobium bilobum]
MDQLAGIIWDATIRLFGFATTHAAYIYKLTENMESLISKSNTLRSIHDDVNREFIEAESTGERRRTATVDDWLQKVQNLQEVIEGIKISPEVQKKCLSGPSYKLGKKVVEKLSEVDELLKLGIPFKNVITYKLEPKRVYIRPSKEIVGLDSMFNQVWNSIEDENMGIIGLYGMGGVGKTTLLGRIHNEFGNRHCDFVILRVVVSRDCDINTIVNEIGNMLRIKDGDWNEISTEQRAGKIYQKLCQKKYVLLLDDLWEKLELEKVGVPYPNEKSKVLFTTRLEDVCSKMQAQKKFKVECLSEQDAFDLFCRKVGDETLRRHTKIEELAWEIVKKCGGLPLALTIIGNAMAGKKSVQTWSQEKKDFTSYSSKASDSKKKLFHILKSSYDRLPDETHKNCFLYCALYPEDYEVKVDGIINQWIGEGFLGKDKAWKSIYDLYEQGESIIEELKLSCLLDGVEYEFEWSSVIKMHSVVRDMALWLACDEDANKHKIVVDREALATSDMDYEKLNVVERISIRGGSGSWQVPTCPNLLTLYVQSNMNTDFSNLHSMTRLKVLDVSDNAYIKDLPIGVLGEPARLKDIDKFGIRKKQDLPKEISKLINLEFLNLSGTRIEGLPIELKNLKSLRILLMEDIDIKIIPLEVIESLKQLKVFRLSTRIEGGSEEEKALLEKLESLPKLEELCIQLKTITGMYKLLGSTKLRECSRRLWLDGIKDTIEMTPLLASLSSMEHLDRITLSFVNNIVEGSSITCHLSKLRGVNIDCCHSITHLTWLRYAPYVESLSVSRCHSIEEVVKEAKDEGEIFSNLRRLELSNLPKLKITCMGKLPNLLRVNIDRCHSITDLTWLRYAPLLESLSVSNCCSIEEVVKEGGQDRDKANYVFSNLIWLSLQYLQKLESIHQSALAFPSLKFVDIKGCPNLRKHPLNSNYAIAKDKSKENTSGGTI